MRDLTHANIPFQWSFNYISVTCIRHCQAYMVKSFQFTSVLISWAYDVMFAGLRVWLLKRTIRVPVANEVLNFAHVQVSLKVLQL